ncbi:MAG: hypothetical protein IPN17_23275 [Deltaproteobacteria bacterium]|nr:hypothetical protein [Deltaproteobacteria bacterium]
MDEEGPRRVSVPVIMDALAMQSPRVRAALHRHINDGEPLVPMLREAHRQLLQEAAELMAVAGAAPFADTPAWPEAEGEEDTVTEAQLLALLAAADRREVARSLVTRRSEKYSVSMLPRDRGR